MGLAIPPVLKTKELLYFQSSRISAIAAREPGRIARLARTDLATGDRAFKNRAFAVVSFVSSVRRTLPVPTSSKELMLQVEAE